MRPNVAASPWAAANGHSLVGRDGHPALEAASRIEGVLEGFTAAKRRVAERGLCEFPAAASDPRRPGPVRAKLQPGTRRVHERLSAAGGETLQTAAAGLAAQVDPVMGRETLAELLDRWLPEGAVGETASAVARRLICDHAGLTTTRWCEHVVSVEALEWFARTAKGLADDAGLVDEVALMHAAKQRGWAIHAVDTLSDACGFVTVLGQLALRQGCVTVCKAALIQIARPASTAEVAEVTGHNPTAVAKALSSCDSARRTGPGMWTAVAPRRFEDPAEIVRTCSDDAGLIDKAALAQAAALRNWDPTQLARSLGCVRLCGRLATGDTHKARAKAALLNLDRPATVAEIAKEARRTKPQIGPALPKIASVTRVGSARWVANEARGGIFAAVAQAAQRCSDDVDLIDEQSLQRVTAEHGPKASLDEIIEACGFVRLCGQLAADDTPKTRITAALVHFDRSATTPEVAAATGLTPQRVNQLLPRVASLTQLARSRWIAKQARNGRAGPFAAAVQACCDDVGLVDEQRLRALIASAEGYQSRFEELCDACGLLQLHGRLATEDTATAAAKAALLHLGRPATLAELAELTERCYSTIRNGLNNCVSVRRITEGRPHTAGQFEVVAGRAEGTY